MYIYIHFYVYIDMMKPVSLYIPVCICIYSFPHGSVVKIICNVGDLGSVPGSGRSPGEGNGYPFQYFCLENSLDRRPGRL